MFGSARIVVGQILIVQTINIKIMKKYKILIMLALILAVTGLCVTSEKEDIGTCESDGVPFFEIEQSTGFASLDTPDGGEVLYDSMIIRKTGLGQKVGVTYN